jgi:hypothetical protein
MRVLVRGGRGYLWPRCHSHTLCAPHSGPRRGAEPYALGVPMSVTLDPYDALESGLTAYLTAQLATGPNALLLPDSILPGWIDRQMAQGLDYAHSPYIFITFDGDKINGGAVGPAAPSSAYGLPDSDGMMDALIPTRRLQSVVHFRVVAIGLRGRSVRGALLAALTNALDDPANPFGVGVIPLPDSVETDDVVDTPTSAPTTFHLRAQLLYRNSTEINSQGTREVWETDVTYTALHSRYKATRTPQVGQVAIAAVISL